MCIFCKIVNGEIPSNKVYEDEQIIIINDINPQAKKHYLVIPKEHFADLRELNLARAQILSHALLTVCNNQKELGITDGFRLVNNNGELAGQTVSHFHMHILAGQKLSDSMC